jgi:hypothetical protein
VPRSEDFDVTERSGGLSQPNVAGEKVDAYRPCECDIGCVVDGEVVAQFPAPGKQRVSPGDTSTPIVNAVHHGLTKARYLPGVTLERFAATPTHRQADQDDSADDGDDA